MFDQRLLDAAMRFDAQLDSTSPLGIDAFVQTVEPEMREELAAFLAFSLDTDDPPMSMTLAPDAQALADIATAYWQRRLREKQALSDDARPREDESCLFNAQHVETAKRT